MDRLGYVPSLLCAEFVMGRVCHVPSLLCAELSLNHIIAPFKYRCLTNVCYFNAIFHTCQYTHRGNIP